MKRNIRTAQAGYALILMVLALMGVGGVVLAGFTQGVKVESEHERYLHNQRILREAKQALLQYAYDYPQLGPGQNDGPGRLPCPDTDNDGDENYVPICGGNIVGRFPWGDSALNFYDARDASGERLWYAVSPNFGRGPGSIINSASIGGITVEDRSGAMLHDGTATIPAGGVAAVIIAPGAPIDRNGTLQVRGTDDEKKDEVNYLDLFGTRDNAVFVNGNPNGFVTGPILDVVTGDLLVNDQMIVITAAEVIAMAEKATLQAYRKAILDYLDKVACTGETPEGMGTTEALCLANGGGWNPVYPWLYNYRDVSNITELSSLYPGFADFDVERDPDPDPDPDTGYLDNYGRIPSIFGEYFAEADTQSFVGLIEGTLSLVDPAGTDTYTLTELYCKDGCPGESGGAFNFQHDLVDDGPTLNFETAQALTDIKFVDIDPDVVGDDGRLSVTFPAAESIGSIEVYFFDNDHSPIGIWTACPAGADELLDCSRNSSGSSTPGIPNNYKSRILHMTVTLDFDDVENFDFDYNPSAPEILVTAAGGTSHAKITAAYDAENIISFPGTLSATYEYERHWHDGGDPALNPDDNTYATGTVDMTGFSLASLTLGMRYFPELPNWAFQNGWHNSIRMAYADNYLPSLASVCVPLPDADPDNDCLTLPEELGSPRNIASLLVIAGEHDWVDGDSDGMADELRDVFDNGNNNNNRSFYSKRSISPLNSDRGNDKLLVIEEL